MPHRCSECKKTYAPNAPEILQGCTCGNRVFQFIKGNSQLNRIKSKLVTITAVAAAPINAVIQTQVALTPANTLHDQTNQTQNDQTQSLQVIKQEITSEQSSQNQQDENNSNKSIEEQTITQTSQTLQKENDADAIENHDEQTNHHTGQENETPIESKVYTINTNSDVELDPAENIKVLEPGTYELDVDRLMKGEPVTVKTEKDVYFVTFKVKKEKKKKR